jgi:hypothetical protein
MDEHGGTDIYQMAPSRVSLSSTESLACVRLSDKGMHRWYCAECKTPLGNTLGPKVPFVGVILGIMAFEDSAARDAALGPSLVNIKPESAIGSVPVSSGWVMARMIAKVLRLIATWWLTGAGKPSALFDEKGDPRAAVRILTPEERGALDRPAAEPAPSPST